MTEPGNGNSSRYQSEQAYSQAIPLPVPPRGPVAPEPVAGIPPAAPPPRSGRTAIVVLVAIAAVAALVAAIVLMAMRTGSDPSGPTAAETAVEQAQLFRANDCLYDVPESPKVGNCDDGGSPYKVTQVMPAGQACRSDQTSIARGRWYCLTPNLNVNYCYTAPVQGTWIKAAQRCGAPGTISVVSVVAGFKDPSRCSGDWDTNFTFDSPVYTICAKSYT